MKLSKAARMGDTMVATDAYGSSQIMVQYEPMSFNKIDGVAVRKRQISAAPDVIMPLRGAIIIDDETYLVGHGAPDYWKGSAIRVSYVIHGADGLANLTSIAESLGGAVPRTAYASLVFSKYMPEANDNSKYPPQYQVFLAGSEDAPADSLIELNSRFFLVKQSYISVSGLRVALANEIENPVFESVELGARTYDPVSDTYSSSLTQTKVMRIKWSEHYLYLSKSSETYERGDMQMFLLKTSSPKPSDTLRLSDGTWRILAVQDEGLLWSCHARRT